MADRILVTGGCGFIGTEVVRQLVARGYQVRVVDNLSKPYSRVPPGVEFVRADLARDGAAEPVFAGVRACINLAARIGGIGYFHRYPATILAENNQIYSNTFEAAVRQKIDRMIFMSSSMVYESAERFPSREEDVARLPPPHTAYGFSKLVGEWYCRAFREQHGLRYTIIRPFNAFGPEEEAGEEVGEAHVIPDLVKKVRSGQYPLELLGDGRQTRCFTHVRDIANGVIVAMESERAVDEDFNLSRPEEITMLGLAEKIFKLFHPDRPFQAKFVPGFPSDIRRRIPDTTKARELLGWQAATSLDDGLKEIVAT
ncbi:MAG TPA: NAD-dependent epimerase/dehydratase family protein [Candidatus Binatia bacterium]|nr:NAD-dependent epimerase/dehydratase family protein [Candidatus Binatia bacterium]